MTPHMAPILIVGKIFFQKLRRKRLGWDKEMPIVLAKSGEEHVWSGSLSPASVFSEWFP